MKKATHISKASHRNNHPLSNRNMIIMYNRLEQVTTILCVNSIGSRKNTSTTTENSTQ